MEPPLPAPKSGTREVLNVVFYLLWSGPVWRTLPHDSPPRKSVYTSFRLWRLAAVWDRARDTVRVGAGHRPGPATCGVDNQTARFNLWYP